jgi:hypothetical protein
VTALKRCKFEGRRKYVRDIERQCREMGSVMNMDVSRHCALVLLMKLCLKLGCEEGKVMESGRSLSMKQIFKHFDSVYVGKNISFYIKKIIHFSCNAKMQSVNPD